MKLIRIFATLLLAIVAIMPFYAVSSAKADTISGKIVILRVEGAGSFYYLKDDKGREIFLCGVWEPSGDPSKEWIAKAEESGQKVTLRGNVVKDGDGYSFENGIFALNSQ